MQVVNTFKSVFLILLILILSSCSKKINTNICPNNNKGGYKYEFSKKTRNSSDSLFVHGYFYDLESNQSLNGSSIHFYCQKILSKDNGYYSFKISSNLALDYFFKGISFGYKTVITNLILPKSDTLQLNFYLEIDTTPIYHCDS